MSTVGIVGAGTMGAGIAHVAALAKHDVILCDTSREALTSAIDRISSELQRGLEKQRLTPSEAADAKSHIRTTTSLTSFSGCSFAIEAAVEKIDVKKEIFSRLEEVVPEQSVIATNTSSLSVTQIASGLRIPERVVGMHFFNPPHIMKLVEVVRGHRTSTETLRQTLEFARTLGKTAVVAADTPGFIVNRVARPFYGEALRLLGEGVATVEEIDRIVKLEGGFKMGPFELMDLIGIDVNLAVTQSIFEQTFGESRYRPHILQRNMVLAGNLGRKTKKGFYRYDS
jgi:3-hydroxybutyryl-CoA dehydrogenase